MSRKAHPQRSRRPSIWIGAALAAMAVAGVLLFVSDRSPPQPAAATPPETVESDAKVFARFAGSQSCRECHASAFNAWTNSHHALAERPVDGALDGLAFDPARTVTHGTQTSEVKRAGMKFQLVAANREGKPSTFGAERVIGVAPLRQFLISGEGGRWQTTELAFDPAQRDWFDIYGNEDRRPGEWGHWTGRGMTWNQMCASCHNTRLRKHYDVAKDSYATTMAERGVNCESCHGPMADHVQWQKARPQPATNDPTVRKFERVQSMAACGSCHARRTELTGEFEAGHAFFDHYLLAIPDETDLYFADGQVRDENYEYTSFLSSRMAASGVWCMDCHEPHSAKVKANDNALCMRCHAIPVAPAPKIDELAHTFHEAGKGGNRCVDCHMPQTTYMQRHPRRDHGFTIPDPLLTKEHGIPNACNRCHTDKSVDWAIAAVDKWYGPRMERPTRVRARVIAKARRGETNAVPELLRIARLDQVPVWRASATRLLGEFAGLPEVKPALLERVGDPTAVVRAQTARALAPLARAGDANATASLRHLLNDRMRAVRVEAAWAFHESIDTNTPAGRDLWQSLWFNCDQPGGAAQLGSFLLARGDVTNALAWFRKSVAWDPYSAPLRDALAVAFSTLGRTAEAAAEMEQACRLAPRDAQFRYRLALALNEIGRLNDAVAALEEAVKIEPQFSAAWYNLGLGYSQQNRSEEAVTALLRAETGEPNSARIPYARATILARLGRNDEARQASARALEIQKDFPEARQLLEMLAR